MYTSLCCIYGLQFCWLHTYLYSKAREAWCGLWESFYKIVQKWKTLIGNWMKCRCIEVNVDMADQALRVVVGTINLVLAPPEIHPLNPQQKEYDPILTI